MSAFLSWTGGDYPDRMNHAAIVRLLACLPFWIPAQAALSTPATIATGGNPASLVAFGQAEATAAISDGTILAARTLAGAGRVVAVGHGGFLTDERGDTAEFVLEETLWLINGVRSARAWGLPETLRGGLEAQGIGVQTLGGGIADLDLANTDLIVGSPQAFARAGRLEDLRSWLLAGGRMLCAETAWGQIQLGHASGVDDLAANQLLAPFGIVYTDRALSPGHNGLYAIDASVLPLANAERSIAALASTDSEQRTLAARVVRSALGTVPLDCSLIEAADSLAERYAAELSLAYESMSERPLKLAESPLACALLDLEARRAKADPQHATAHPSAAAFPGPVPSDAPRITRRLTIDDHIPGWRSTGLYAPPGERVTVRVLDGSADGAHIQVGAWLDPQDFDDRPRMPVAVFRSPIRDGGGICASPIGGPIYIDLPESDQPRHLTIEVSGGVEMPRFRLGHTSLPEWQHRRDLPAPWAELESDALVLTLPAEAIRDLDRPDLVMTHWDTVHKTMQELEPRSPGHWPRRQYRYVAEKRLSWGYMYCPSDGPLVIPMTEARPMVMLENFDGKGSNELWGHYHEMGHSHQNQLWTFAGTGEVTVNIFTVLALNTVNGYTLDDDATRTSPEYALAVMHDHVAGGAPFDKWKADPFLALQTYALLWQTFGWDAFRATFRSYDSIPASELPNSDDAKRDRFVVQFSRAVGRNLAPYFDAWGVPISDDIRIALSDLPVWMPEGLDLHLKPED